MATTDELLQLVKSYAVGMLKGNTVDTLGAPVDIINEAIVRPALTAIGKGDKVSKEPVGGSKSLRRLLGLEVEDANPAETVASMISAGGAAKAIIAPAFLVKSLKQVKKAERALNEGTDAAQVEKYTGIFRLPENVNDGVLRAVIDDSKAKLITSPGKLERISGNMFGGLSTGPSQLIRFQIGDIVKLPEVLDHPELYKAMPELADIKVGAAPQTPIGGAFYSDADKYIGLGFQVSEKNAMAALLHETQHAVQNKYGMNLGGNPWQFMERPNEFAAAKKILESNRQSSDRFLLQDVYSDAIKEYNKLAGEAEANAVERMLNNPTKGASTLSYYGDEYAINRMIASSIEGRKVDQDPAIRAIIESALRAVSSPVSSKP